jgi:cob(I)alamin adenosyltransferase
MGKRLSKIYTRTGDKGQTGLADGSRIQKSSYRIEAIGEVDELNSTIGILTAELDRSDVLQAPLSMIQQHLFNIGGMLATPEPKMLLIQDEHVHMLEQTLDTYNADLPPLSDFILPGGTEAVARAHLARAVCRRAERALIKLHEHEPIQAELISYINRLSDLLFVIARVIGARTHEREVLWDKNA